MELNDAKLIELKDKHLFDKYFLEFQPKISEFTFTNLFIWRHHYNFFYKEWKNHLIVFSKSYLSKWKAPINLRNDTLFFLPPIGREPDKIIIELFKDIQNIEIHRVPEAINEKISKNKNYNSLNLDSNEDRNNWDYIYEKQDLLSLPGNNFRQKRRRLNKFLTTYDHEFHFISDEWIEVCKQLQLEWCDMNECQSNEDLQEEQEAILEAFNNFDDLSLSGGLIMIDGKSIAYTIGEKMNREMMVIHFEKAHVDYEGSYQAINNLFAKNCCKDVKYINREQDLGIEGIRRAKESYKPHHMVKKYIIFRK
jgi:hypothetical protein